jgi:outer membrane receptor protein involved in Fe transport
VFLDCRNLTNQRYASSIDVIADARTEPNPEIFHPGDGRSFYGGVSWSW